MITPIWSKDDTQLFTTAEDISERWKEHYETLLNCNSTAQLDSLDDITQLPIVANLDLQPTWEEVDVALKSFSDGKAPGIDGISVEIWKCGGRSLIRILLDLFHRCWRDETLPQDFRESKIVSIFKKKGSKNICGNYRGISLLCVAGKILARIMLSRLSAAFEDLLPESQCGFRPGRSTIDMIFSLRQLQEKSVEQRQPLYIAFVDFRKAFDMVDRDMLWGVLRKYGCPEHFLCMIQQFHIGMTATVLTGGNETASFGVHNGVRQGCVLAPLLFSVFLTAVLAVSRLDEVQGVNLVSRSDGKLFNLARLKARTKVRQVCVRELLYADDAALTANSLVELQIMLNRFTSAASQFGLIVNTDKTEVLYQPPPTTPYVAPIVTVNDVQLKAVQNFVYLGSAVTGNNSSDAEITRRIQAASVAYGRLKSRVWNNNSLRTSTKMAVYRAVVITVLIYSLETCALYRKQLRKLTSVQLWHLRQVLGVAWQDYVPNVEVLKMADMPSVEALLSAANIRWTGHVSRMNDSRLPKSIMYGELSLGSRSVGGQKLRFKDVFKRNLKIAGGPVDDWEELAGDRVAYREVSRRAIVQVEQRRYDEYMTARERRHNPPPVGEALQCPHCGQLCRRRVGLAAHMRARHRN